jgi:hypothetical protein
MSVQGRLQAIATETASLEGQLARCAERDRKRLVDRLTALKHASVEAEGGMKELVQEQRRTLTSLHHEEQRAASDWVRHEEQRLVNVSVALHSACQWQMTVSREVHSSAERAVAAAKALNPSTAMETFLDNSLELLIARRLVPKSLTKDTGSEVSKSADAQLQDKREAFAASASTAIAEAARMSQAFSSDQPITLAEASSRVFLLPRDGGVWEDRRWGSVLSGCAFESLVLGLLSDSATLSPSHVELLRVSATRLRIKKQEQVVIRETLNAFVADHKRPIVDGVSLRLDWIKLLDSASMDVRAAWVFRQAGLVTLSLCLGGGQEAPASTELMEAFQQVQTSTTDLTSGVDASRKADSSRLLDEAVAAFLTVASRCVETSGGGFSEHVATALACRALESCAFEFGLLPWRSQASAGPEDVVSLTRLAMGKPPSREDNDAAVRDAVSWLGTVEDPATSPVPPGASWAVCIHPALLDSLKPPHTLLSCLSLSRHARIGALFLALHSSLGAGQWKLGLHPFTCATLEQCISGPPPPEGTADALVGWSWSGGSSTSDWARALVDISLLGFADNALSFSVEAIVIDTGAFPAQETRRVPRHRQATSHVVESTLLVDGSPRKARRPTMKAHPASPSRRPRAESGNEDFSAVEIAKRFGAKLKRRDEADATAPASGAAATAEPTEEASEEMRDEVRLSLLASLSHTLALARSAVAKLPPALSDALSQLAWTTCWPSLADHPAAARVVGDQLHTPGWKLLPAAVAQRATSLLQDRVAELYRPIELQDIDTCVAPVVAAALLVDAHPTAFVGAGGMEQHSSLWWGVAALGFRVAVLSQAAHPPPREESEVVEEEEQSHSVRLADPSVEAQESVARFHLVADLETRVLEMWDALRETPEPTVTTVATVVDDESSVEATVRRAIEQGTFWSWYNSSKDQHNSETLAWALSQLREHVAKSSDSENLPPFSEEVMKDVWTRIEAAFSKTRTLACGDCRRQVVEWRRAETVLGFSWDGSVADPHASSALSEDVTLDASAAARSVDESVRRTVEAILEQWPEQVPVPVKIQSAIVAGVVLVVGECVSILTQGFAPAFLARAMPVLEKPVELRRDGGPSSLARGLASSVRAASDWAGGLLSSLRAKDDALASTAAPSQPPTADDAPAEEVMIPIPPSKVSLPLVSLFFARARDMAVLQTLLAFVTDKLAITPSEDTFPELLALTARLDRALDAIVGFTAAHSVLVQLHPTLLLSLYAPSPDSPSTRLLPRLEVVDLSVRAVLDVSPDALRSLTCTRLLECLCEVWTRCAMHGGAHRFAAAGNSLAYARDIEALRDMFSQGLLPPAVVDRILRPLRHQLVSLLSQPSEILIAVLEGQSEMPDPPPEVASLQAEHTPVVESGGSEEARLTRLELLVCCRALAQARSQRLCVALALLHRTDGPAQEYVRKSGLVSRVETTIAQLEAKKPKS